MATKPVAVCFADAHLADRTWAYRPITGDAYHSFRQVVDYAINHDLPLIGAGDLLDRNLNRSTVIAFMHQQLDRLAEAHIPIYITQGQHEAAELPWLCSHRHARHLHKQTLMLGEMTLYGLDYQAAGVLQQELAQIPKNVDVLVAHQTWAEFGGDIQNPQGSFTEVPVVSDVFTGDYHATLQKDLHGADGQKLHVVSPGALAMQSIDEASDKSFFVLCDDGLWEEIPLLTRSRLIWPLITRETMVDELVETVDKHLELARAGDAELPEELQTPLLWVTYHHHVTDARRRILQAVGDRAHLFFKEIPPQKSAVSTAKVAAENGQGRAASMLNCLPAFLAEKKLTSYTIACQRLLQAEDLAGELVRMKAEALQ